MIVFLTVYLGLIAGRQPFELRADPAVRTIRLLLDGNRVATMTEPPWKTVVDLGPAILPREIVAIGLDASGNEIARASQILNLPRPQAEVNIVVERDAKGTPARAALEAQHIKYVEPRRASLKLDDVLLSLDEHRRASLPPLDMKHPHVLSGEMTFADGAVARREIVFGGEFSESMPTELTAVALVRTTADAGAPPAEGCFVSNGVPLRVSSVEKSGAAVVIVRDPDTIEIRRGLPVPTGFGAPITTILRSAAHADADLALLIPVADRFRAADQPTSMMFPLMLNRDQKIGVYWFIASTVVRSQADAPRQWADAVAVAGIRAVSDGRRRAVILVLGSAPDRSQSSPAGVRRYLDALGVPLFVWSVKGARPDLADSWGSVEDVSSREKLEHATAAVNAALDRQRIAWLYADPLTALHAQVKEGCGFTALARL